MVEHRSPKPGVGGSRPSTPASPEAAPSEIDGQRGEQAAKASRDDERQHSRRDASVSPGEFIRQVRQEAAKVTWPSRKETLITTAMVFAMSILAAIFFLVVDWVLSHGRAIDASGCGG